MSRSKRKQKLPPGLPAGPLPSAAGVKPVKTAWWMWALPLIGLYVFASLMRVHHYEALDFYDPRDGTGLFWTESAFQFRYAEKVAKGEDIPDFDPKVQHPKGLKIKENETVVMEYLDGWLFRRLKPEMPLHAFLVRAVCWTTSLAVFAAFLAGWALWRSPWAGLAAAALYAVAMPSYTRIMGSYGREHLAFPMVFSSVACVVTALRSDGRRMHGWYAAAAVFLGLALGSWHLSRFYFAVFATAWILTWAALTLWAPEQAKKVAAGVAWLVAGVYVASLLSPVLRTRLFVFSPFAAALWALPIAEKWKASSPTKNRLIAGLALFAGLFVAASFLPKGGDSDSHVWAVMFAKFQHFGVKPTDPSLLPFEARLMWIEDFNSPDLRILFYTYGALPLLTGLALWAAWGGFPSRRDGAAWEWKWFTRTDPAVWAFCWLSIAFLVLFALIQRMTGFLIFFVCVWAAGAFLSKKPWIVTAAVFMLLFETHKSVLYGKPTAYKNFLDRNFEKKEVSPISNWHPNNIGVLNWVKHHTQPEDGFLARFGTSPMLLAYADRPIVIQSKIENQDVRERIRQFMDAMYGSEDDLYRFAADNQVRYLLYEARTALDAEAESDRWVANRLTLPVDSAAYRLHFATGTLKHFTLMFQNSFYRIFAVHPAGQGPQTPSVPYQPTYDASLYGPQPGPLFDESATMAVMRRVERAVAAFGEGQRASSAGNLPAALRFYETAAELNPGLMGVHSARGLTLYRLGRNEEALAALALDVAHYPEFVSGIYDYGFVLVNTGQIEEAQRVWMRGLFLDPTHRGIREGLLALQKFTQSNRRLH